MSPDLQASLREAAGPTPQPDIDAILSRASRRRRRARLAGVAVAAAAAVGGLVGGQALLRPETTITAGESATDGSPVLAATGTATTVATGSVDGSRSWQLVAYPVSSAPGRTETRLCTEFRGAADGPQSCFPVMPGGSGWAFVERHLGHLFLVVAAEPEVSLQLDDRPLTAAPGQEGLPVRFFVTELPDDPEYRGWLTSDAGAGQAVGGPMFMEAEGSRQLLAHPAAPGVALERLTSKDPAADGWPVVGGSSGGVAGYLNPGDLDGLPGDEPTPMPVYGEDGEQIGIFGACGFQTDPEAACDNTPTTTENGSTSTEDSGT